MKLSVIFIVAFSMLVVISSGKVARKYKVVCYFTNWARTRGNGANFLPKNIDAKLCTHIVYSFAVLDPNSLTIVRDQSVDTDDHFYKQITDFRRRGIKVSIAIGGGKDSVASKYGRLLTNENARRQFIKSVIDFISKHNFQGLDLDLEYPACWQGTCSAANSAQKAGFAHLVQEVSKAFKSRGWLLSAAVSAFYTVIDGAYDVPTLAKYLDWIGLMAYDFHGTWNKKTGQNAPLFNYPGNEINNYADYGVKYWIQRGAPSKKLILGVPTYGITYTLANITNHGLNAPTKGPGKAGSVTKSAGQLSYYEICNLIQHHGWNVVHSKKIGPYAFKGNQWVSFDDIDTMRIKSKYIRDKKLAGAMIWALDFDDFKGKCSQGKNPLLSALNKGLGR